MILNPGSEAPAMRGAGWSNTVEKAREAAAEWLGHMHAAGMDEVVLDGEVPSPRRGPLVLRLQAHRDRRHRRTGDARDRRVRAYKREHIFDPRVYWRGSSTATPEIGDFAAPGFRVRRTFVKDEG